jgi:hypothetical protein
VKTSVFIDGRFSLTNKMLSNLRAAGKAEGMGLRCVEDRFAAETAAIRLAAAASVRGLGRLFEPVNLSFWVFGHHRHDPDAWYLLGKPVVDGFCDAGMLDRDRFSIWIPRGRVCRSGREESLFLAQSALWGAQPHRAYRLGVLVDIETVGTAVGHA